MPFLTRTFAFLGCLASTALFSPSHAAMPEKPNIIFILADDVGLGDVHCTGGHYLTPNIDALAQGGTRFEHCYATPLCGPSRCQALTGRYPFRTGLNTNGSANAVSPEHEVMIPTVMKKAGYATASAGKWGQICLGPREWGFDEHIVFKGSGRYWREQTKSYNINGDEKDLPEGVYIPDLLHDFAVDFITRHKDGPFFLYYPMSSIHGPIVHTPDSKPGASKDELYADNVMYMDKMVGKLMAELDRLKLREKTLVLFAGDNGTARFGKEISTVDGRAINGMKATMQEGGSRVPLIVNWPGITPAGKISHDLVDFSDYFATFAQIGGAALPEGVTLDSRSFAPQIKGETGTPREWTYVELGGKSYARDARYKLTNSGEFFDLKNAPFEEIPVPLTADDAGAIASRAKLLTVLADHPAKAGDGKNGKAGKKGKKGKKNRRGQQPVPVTPTTTTPSTTAVPPATESPAIVKKGKGGKKKRAQEAAAAALAAKSTTATPGNTSGMEPASASIPDPETQIKRRKKNKKLQTSPPAVSSSPVTGSVGNSDDTKK